MATLIRLKRKKTSGTTNAEGVKLRSGEPVYNLEDKKLYIGNKTTNDSIAEKLPKDQKHITEIENQDTADNATVSFSVGEASDNVYTKTVNRVAISRSLVLDSKYFGTEADRNKLTNVEVGTVFFQEAE